MICWLNVFAEEENENNVLLGSALPMPEGLTIGPDLWFDKSDIGIELVFVFVLYK